MIIDCHGHYTTAPAQLEQYRKRQIAELEGDPGHIASAWPLDISDDQIRESLENAQLRILQHPDISTLRFKRLLSPIPPLYNDINNISHLRRGFQ